MRNKFRLSLIFCILLLNPFSRVLSCTLADSVYVTGNVFNQAGSPLNQLKISVYTDPGSVLNSPDVSGTTCKEGSFRFKIPAGLIYLVELEGDQGAGRIVISGTKRSTENLSIEYPVVEKVVILHTNDHHFTFNKLPEFRAAVDRLREKYDDVFLFCSGDIFVRHPARWIVNGKLMRDPGWYGERTMYMINNMNELGYDLLTPGNHEFAYREPYTRQALDAAQFPLVAANIKISTDAFPPVEQYVVFKTSTWRDMTVLGLSNGSADGIQVLDVSETVNQLMHLRDSCDIFIALTHIGLRRDRALAEEFPQFDVIIGGHSHDLLKDAIMVNSVLVAQAGGNPHFVSDHYPVYIGKVILTLENGFIRDKRGRVFELEDSGSGTGKKKQPEVEFFAVPEF